MKQLFSITLLGLILLTSCTKTLEEVNINPNSPSVVEPDFLLTTSIFESMNLYGGQMDRAVFYNYTHHYSGFQGEFQRYTYNPGDNSTYWRNTYIRCLQPVHQIVMQYSDKPAYKNRVMIARIWKDYIFSNTVSIWGSIPTTDALNGTPSVSYQKEQDIYYSLLTDLKNLADSLPTTGDKYSATADKIYGGDLLKWKKFANTLRLRLAMRISAADPARAQQEVADLFTKNQMTITSEAETATAVWGTTSDSWSPLYDRVVYNYTANKATIPVINESLIYHMLPYNDPRLPVYAQPAKQGPQINKYFGQNIAYGGGAGYARYPNTVNPHTGLKQDDYSQIGTRFLKPDAEYVFLSYAESAFLKAEAALKGWWGTTATASTYYYEGIDASILRYGLTTAQATAYKNTPGIKWGVASDTVGRESQFQDWLRIASSYVPAGDYMRQIVMQHWLAIPGQGVDAWALLRRTQILEFEPQFATYDGDYKYMPQRIPYPSDELQTNAAEVKKAIAWLGGPDDLFTKLWFALPTKKNPYLPY